VESQRGIVVLYSIAESSPVFVGDIGFLKRVDEIFIDFRGVPWLILREHIHCLADRSLESSDIGIQILFTSLPDADDGLFEP